MTFVLGIVGAFSSLVLAAPLDADTDYDGRPDAQELADGTDPLDASSFERVRLGYWRFNRADWAGEDGQLPLLATNLQQPASFDGLALQVTNTGGLLRYRDVETNGQVNINCRCGSIRFWFKPNWSSTTIGGTGPGDNIRLLALGDFKAPGSNTNANDGCFLLSINPQGTGMGLSLQNNLGNTEQPGSRPVTFVSNVWHEIIVTFDTHNVSFWFNGVFSQRQEFKDVPYPPAGARGRGFCVGNGFRGGQPINGQIDELETFNYPIGFVGAAATGQMLSATVASSPPQIELHWRARPGPTLALQRKLPTDSSWTLLTTNHHGWTYTDTNVSLGQKYEYQVFPAGLQAPKNVLYLMAGLNLPPVENRGKVILLVDNTIANALVTELAQLQQDLIGDGWAVLRHDVARHDDSVWANNLPRIAAIKAQVISDYNADPTNARALLIVGHVAVPYTGVTAEDGHVDHYGAWSSDLYYGDVDGIWTDVRKGNAKISYPETLNIPGDGKFDQDVVPRNSAGVAHLELSVGRVDFAKMPAFARARPPRSETSLLSAYLNKDHAYRHKNLNFAPRAIEHSFFAYGNDDVVFARTAVNFGSRWFGRGPDRTVDADMFTEKRSHLWGFQYGFGGPDRIAVSTPKVHTTQALTESAVPVAFSVVFGSWFGDWNLQGDNFMRALLCASNSGLATVWVGYALESLALGESLGGAQLLVANRPNGDGLSKTGGFMGDQTLRLNVVAPPRNVTAAATGSDVNLTWTASPEIDPRYFVYRSTNGLDGRFSRLTAEPIKATAFTDANAPTGRKLYEVRALKLEATGSGSYLNLSQGIFQQAN